MTLQQLGISYTIAHFTELGNIFPQKNLKLLTNGPILQDAAG